MNDTVSPSITAVIEHFFEDARFMVPLNYPILPQLTPIATTTQPTPDKIPTIKAPTTNQQSQDKALTVKAHIESIYVATSNTNSTTNSQVSNNLDAPKHNFTAYEQSSGEAIVSLRQFATQFTEPLQAVVPTISPGNIGLIQYDPYRTYYLDTAAVENTQSDKLDYILSPFAFHKGSRHVRVYLSSTATTPNYFSAILDSTPEVTSRITSLDTISTAPHAQTQRVIPVVKPLEGIADIHLPYYQPYHMVRNQPANSTLISANHADPHILSFRATANSPYFISRAAGDDFSAGYLCGLPPYCIAAAATSRLPPQLP